MPCRGLRRRGKADRHRTRRRPRTHASPPEIQHLDDAAFADHHVGRLQVPVHDAGLVRRRESIRDLGGDTDRVSQIHGRPPASRSRVWPDTRSIAMKSISPSRPTPCTVTMLG